MIDAPERIWAEPGMPGYLDEPHEIYTVEYVRADLMAALQAENERLRAVAEAAQWARNRLERIADDAWHGDGRDLKRSLVGVFADFDEALLRVGSKVPQHIRAGTQSRIKEGE